MSQASLQGPSRAAASPARATAGPEPKSAGRLLQRKCDCGSHSQAGECESCKKRQRRPAGEDTGRGAVPAIVSSVLQSPGRSLDSAARGFMEPRFGRDFSQVLIHTEPAAGRSAREVGALAYTVGQHIVFAPGRYDPGHPKGQRLLAHELAHTIQQAGTASVGQARLEVDPGGSPAEAAADRAADAVIAGAPVPSLQPVGPLLSRQQDGEPIRETQQVTGPCHGNLSPTELINISQALPPFQNPPTPMSVRRVERVSDDERRVILTSGQRYLVRRVRWTGPEETTGSARPHARPAIDQDQVWVEISWCEGSRSEGQIRVGANVPEQVIQLLVQTLSNGGDLGQAWRQASITPQVSGDFRAGEWRVTPSVQTTVSSGGQVTGVQGSVGVSRNTPIGNAGVQVSGGSQPVGSNPLGGGQVSISFTLSGREPERPPCRRHTVRSGMRYECRQEVDVPERSRPGTQATTTTERHVHNLFFHYAVPRFDDSRNAQGIAGLTTDLAAGFQVRNIEGWASPEGPPTPGQGSFVGNTELSHLRAEAARGRVALLCGTGSCFAADATVTGRGERLDPADDQGRPQEDVSGPPLEQHVDRTFPTDPGEAPVRSRAVMDRLGRTPSLHRRTEQIYPLLRRAEITLTRTQNGTGACVFTVPAHQAETIGGSCPPGLVDAAFPAGTGTTP